MKILQIIPTLGSGGAERFTVDLCNELVEQGHEVVLCTLYNLNAKKEYSFFKKEVKSDVKLINCNKKLGFDFTLFFKLFKLIKKEQPQVVHSHLSVLNYMLLAVFLIKNRYIHTLHNDAFKLLKNKGEYWLRKIVYSGKWVQPICISEES
ncbi:MAG: glycosyltransferase, partial [Flavobacteriales bacterium]